MLYSLLLVLCRAYNFITPTAFTVNASALAELGEIGKQNCLVNKAGSPPLLGFTATYETDVIDVAKSCQSSCSTSGGAPWSNYNDLNNADHLLYNVKCIFLMSLVQACPLQIMPPVDFNKPLVYAVKYLSENGLQRANLTPDKNITRTLILSIDVPWFISRFISILANIIQNSTSNYNLIIYLQTITQNVFTYVPYFTTLGDCWSSNQSWSDPAKCPDSGVQLEASLNNVFLTLGKFIGQNNGIEQNINYLTSYFRPLFINYSTSNSYYIDGFRLDYSVDYYYSMAMQGSYALDFLLETLHAMEYFNAATKSNETLIFTSLYSFFNHSILPYMQQCRLSDAIAGNLVVNGVMDGHARHTIATALFSHMHSLAIKKGFYTNSSSEDLKAVLAGFAYQARKCFFTFSAKLPVRFTYGFQCATKLFKPTSQDISDLQVTPIKHYGVFWQPYSDTVSIITDTLELIYAIASYKTAYYNCINNTNKQGLYQRAGQQYVYPVEHPNKYVEYYPSVNVSMFQGIVAPEITPTDCTYQNNKASDKRGSTNSGILRVDTDAAMLFEFINPSDMRAWLKLSYLECTEAQTDNCPSGGLSIHTLLLANKSSGSSNEYYDNILTIPLGDRPNIVSTFSVNGTRISSSSQVNWTKVSKAKYAYVSLSFPADTSAVAGNPKPSRSSVSSSYTTGVCFYTLVGEARGRIIQHSGSYSAQGGFKPSTSSSDQVQQYFLQLQVGIDNAGIAEGTPLVYTYFPRLPSSLTESEFELLCSTYNVSMAINSMQNPTTYRYVDIANVQLAIWRKHKDKYTIFNAFAFMKPSETPFYNGSMLKSTDTAFAAFKAENHTLYLGLTDVSQNKHSVGMQLSNVTNLKFVTYNCISVIKHDNNFTFSIPGLRGISCFFNMQFQISSKDETRLSQRIIIISLIVALLLISFIIMVLFVIFRMKKKLKYGKERLTRATNRKMMSETNIRSDEVIKKMAQQRPAREPGDKIYLERDLQDSFDEEEIAELAEVMFSKGGLGDSCL